MQFPIRPLGAAAVAALALAACGENPVATSDADLEVLAVRGGVPANAPAPTGSAATGSASVYVIHGINGTDVDPSLPEALPVDVEVNGACALPGFTFRTITDAISLPAGSYDIVVKLADEEDPCAGDAVITVEDLPLEGGTSYSVIAHLDADGAPTATAFVNDLGRYPGRATLAARHTAAFSAVDVLFNGATAFGGVENGIGGTAIVRPGRSTVAIAPAGASDAVFSARPVLNPFTFYAFYAVGTPENGTFEVLSQAIPIGTRNN